MTELFLSKPEIAALTGKCKYFAQVKALRTMAVPHRVRPDGVPIVLRADLSMREDKPNKAHEPDYSLI